MLITIAIIAALSLGAVTFLSQDEFGKEPSGERLEKIQKSPNYRAGKFQNIEQTNMWGEGEGNSAIASLWDYFKNKSPRQIPADSLPTIFSDLKTFHEGGNKVVWFGHSSFLMNLEGKTFLADPVFSEYASPIRGIAKAFKGTNRYKAEDMPYIDILLITHDHWDHLDYKTLRELKDRVGMVICGLGIGETLELWGYPTEKIKEVDWGDSVLVSSGITVVAHTARHFSGRSLKRNQTLWCSYSIHTPDIKVFLSGDTGYGKHFKHIGESYGPFDLALLENGQYAIEMAKYPIHSLPEQVAIAAQELGAKRVIPIHHSKFALMNHGWDDPLKDAANAFKATGIPLLTPKIGEVVNVDDTTQVFGSWWHDEITPSNVNLSMVSQ